MNLRIIILILISILNACGFHLRGHQEAAPTSSTSSIVLNSISAPAVTAELTSILALNGTKVVRKSDSAEYILTISNESFNRDVLSVSAETGKVREYQLTLRVIMAVSDTSGKSLVDNEPISVTRDYTFDDTSILGKSNEELDLRKDLVRQVSMQIVRRYNAVTSR